MGKVVTLTDGGSRQGSRGSARSRATTSWRGRRVSKTALVLGGGGLTGGVYEIGALRALDLLSMRHTVNEFDVYVGTSAGAFVAAAVANGVTPQEMMRAIVDDAPTSFPDVRAGSLLKPNYREFITSSVKFPWRLASVARSVARDLGQMSAVDVVLGLAEALPSGMYSGRGLEGYVRKILTESDPALGRSDDFRKLDHELYITATDLDSCERVVFGAEGLDDVPISRAVSASGALPMIYKPVRINDREYVDGGLVSTTNIDVAVEAGAKLVVVINPLVPYINDLSTGRSRRISQMGFPQIGYQAFKLLVHQRLHELARQWEERYPGVDIILIEPSPADELMFRTSVMNFTSRVQIARHGFESVTLHLAGEYGHYKEICARHGIEISGTRVRNVVRHLAADDQSVGAWRRILEQTTATLLRQSAQRSAAQR